MIMTALRGAEAVRLLDVSAPVVPNDLLLGHIVASFQEAKRDIQDELEQHAVPHLSETASLRRLQTLVTEFANHADWLLLLLSGRGPDDDLTRDAEELSRFFLAKASQLSAALGAS